MVKVFIDGKEGTTGLRIFERFAVRNDAEILLIEEEKRKDPERRRELINSSDITFLCLPDDSARESVSLVENEKTVIIDTSTAHRTADGWSYGFPELSPKHKENIINGKRIAVPGCHATGFISLVYPLVKSGLLSEDALVSCFSLTGYSGGGKKMIAQYRSEDAPDSPGQYGLTQQHKHLKEMTAICGLKNPPIFSPIVAPYYSGMSVSVPLHASLLGGLTAQQVEEFYKTYYAGSRFISVKQPEGLIYGGTYSGYDGMVISVVGNDERIVLTSNFDNLGKGASGAAIQCFNLITGADETTALDI